MRNAEQKLEISGFWGGAPHTHTSAYHGPEKVFLDTWDGCVCNGQCKKLMRVFRVAIRTHIPLHTKVHKKAFWIPRMRVFAMRNADNCWGFLGWRSVHTYLCIPWARKAVSRYLGWVCLQTAMQNNTRGFWGGAPYTHTSAHHGPQKVFLDTWDGCVCNAQCRIIPGVSGVALCTHIPLHTKGQKRGFGIHEIGVFAMVSGKE